MGRPHIWFDIDAVRFLRGHDGFLRGKPEPLLLVGVYAVGDGRIRTAGTGQLTPVVSGPYPCVHEPPQRRVCAKKLPRGTTRVVVLALGLEVDSGQDARVVAGGLADAAGWVVRGADGAYAVPFSLSELSLLSPFCPPRGGMRVHARLEGVDLGELCQRDDWVGGAVLVLDPTRPGTERWELVLRSEDGRNHWVAGATCTFGA